MATDPARTLALLWRVEQPAGTRGPRRGLDLDDVVARATALADAGGPDGLAGLSVRALARELGVAPMTLYTYVPGREELAALVVDAAYAAMPRRDTSGLGWRERLTAVAEENLALHRAHPWAARVDPGRPVLGPGETAKYEHELAAFDELATLAGLDDVDRDAALTFLLDVTRAAALVEQHTADTGDAGAWWAARAPVLEQVLDPGRFPRAVRVGAAAGAAQQSARDPDRAWRFGLARVLDGLAALIG
ncbi:TetR/AcrR family transcriptional regulator C-terminal domain-containing protein [Actinomycetospora lutea]|uniref:TetR/AcrR family transcriptional regulator C-terminal domain-containing protein n=1 Tax=Actinomycetospora lutea TaxID=663604 RepID=UPI002366174E|nr:TetR/AcrR family transcriptional regulator C-terminal domain-containing protein [Actinomycetospora lutea]MDD7938855.1 TetR/AcrR family transcriptional regulator C-terminal domain-containing protein [Actinomycetospora lutea]